VPGSNLERRRERRLELKRLRRRAFRKSPCDRPPETPENLVGDFDTKHRRRHDRIRAKLRWGEVVLDTSGIPIRIRGYDVEWNFSTDGGVVWDDDPERFFVSAKDDTDPNTKAHLVIKSINKRLYYRWRVRTQRDKDCKSEWSDWDELGFPTDTVPPDAPTNVKIKRAAQGIRLVWKAPDDSDDEELIDDDIDHFIATLHSNSNFSTASLVERRRLIRNEHVVFQIDDDEVNDGPFYGRVRSVSETGVKSAWIPATKAGNSSPGAAPEGRQPRHVPTISSAAPNNGDILVYDSSDERYEPEAPGGGGGEDLDFTTGELMWDYTDMMAVPDLTGTGSGNMANWGFNTLGTGAGTASLTAEPNHPGICRFDTGSGNNSQGRVHLQNAGLGLVTNVPVGSGRVRIGAWVRYSAASTSTERYVTGVGLSNQGIIDYGDTGEHGIFITARDDRNSGAWEGVALSNGTETLDPLDDNGGAVTLTANTWYHLLVDIDAAASSVDFYINGVLKGTISSGIPTNNMGVHVTIKKQAGNTSRKMDVDAVYILHEISR